MNHPLISAMKAAGVTTVALAARLTERLGRTVHRTDVSRWRSRARLPSYTIALVVCDELGIPEGPAELRLLAIGYREVPGIVAADEQREDSPQHCDTNVTVPDPQEQRA